MSVTGLKAWHLRPGSDFYTSASFDATVLVRVRVRVRVRVSLTLTRGTAYP